MPAIGAVQRDSETVYKVNEDLEILWLFIGSIILDKYKYSVVSL